MDERRRSALVARGLDDIFDAGLRTSIGALIDDVRERGDDAVCDALGRFDGIEIEPDGLRVSADELDSATVSDDVDAAIDDAIVHLRSFNEQQLARFEDWSFESEPGLTVGEKISPITSAGLFTPSGKASYPSVAYQLAVPAVVAGVPSLALVVPPVPGGAGEVDPAVLVVCRKLGVRDVFRVNGPAGIAALGFGTERIPRVAKVMGPGSPAVTIAQVEMQRHGVATVMLLGPTESVVIADDSADPVRLAADLLIEAEHGTDSSVVLLATGERIVDEVEAELVIATRRVTDGARRSGSGGARAERWCRDRRHARHRDRGRQPLCPRAPAGRRHRRAGRPRRRRSRERRRDPDRPGHAVQRSQLRHRLSGVVADERIRTCELGDHGRDVPEANGGRPGRGIRARPDERFGDRAGRSRGVSGACGRDPATALSWG